jgi:diaminopimelate decarboxylase
MAEAAATGDRIDECLSVRAGHLWIEDCDVVELAERFGTPVYVVSENQLRRNAHRLFSAFGGQWPGPVRVLPSIKANHVLALRRILTSEGLGCDTFGRAELWAALACGVPPSLISVNGTGKSAELVAEAVAAGCRITLDSPRELDLVVAAARRLERPAQVRVRVRPDLSGLGQAASDFSVEGESITEVARRYKAGIPMNEVLPLGERALLADEVELVGIHAHFARHTSSLDVWAADRVAECPLPGADGSPVSSTSAAASPRTGIRPAGQSRASGLTGNRHHQWNGTPRWSPQTWRSRWPPTASPPRARRWRSSLAGPATPT